MSSGEIDAAVVKASKAGESLYEIDGAALRRLRPDLVLTQDLCDV
jgi:iron complex transport system substrate-binding protein